MQERPLARHVLHFVKRQIAWECCEEDSAANEEHPTGVHIVEDNTGSWKTRAPFEAMDLSNAVETCSMVVKQYSKMDLTVSDDKLVAISGVAKHIMARVEIPF